jgi:hypothetical protein
MEHPVCAICRTIIIFAPTKGNCVPLYFIFKFVLMFRYFHFQDSMKSSDSGGELESCRSSDSGLERELAEKEREIGCSTDDDSRSSSVHNQDLDRRRFL